MLPKMSKYAKRIDETKYMSFFKGDELLKNIKSGIKLEIVSKRNLIVNQCITRNILKLKKVFQKVL